MKTVRTRPTRHQRIRWLLPAALTLSFLLVAGALPAAAYDPATPTSNKGAGNPPPGGDPPGGDPPGGGHVVALGVAVEDGSNMAALDAHAVAVGGNTPAYWVLRTSWGGDFSDFPTASANQLRDRGVTPIVWWTPIDPADQGSPEYARHRNVTRGDHDAYIRQFARDAKAYGGKVLLRFAHEVNSNFFPWSANNHDNSPQTFIDMWRHVHGLFEAEGATNVRWVWSLAKESCPGCNPFVPYWPGAQYVDVMAFSGYNWGTHRSWVSMWQTYKRPMIDLMAISSKPIMAAETGSSPDGGDKADWIRTGYDEVYDSWPQLKAIVWTDVDLRSAGHPDWRIASPPAALVAYREIASDPRFKGRDLFKARQIATTKATQNGHRAKQSPKRSRTSDRASKADRGSRVEKGAAVSDEPRSAESRGAKQRNETSRPGKKDGKKKDQHPPQVLDTFSR